jgi:phosphoglucosamine mutase
LAPGDIASLHVVIDCANGAASHVAHELFESTGATITMIHDQPNGRNINENCGSTCVGDLVAAVKELGADLGLALDGDADRLIAVDHEGVVRDGDDMMVLFALDRLRAGTLGAGLVVTSMSNLGLHRALANENVDVVEVDVGDRNVLRALEERAWNFGGEQSGHLIFRELSPTGDGLLTGLLLSELVVRRGALGAQAKAAWRRVPQALVNVDRDLYDDDVVQKIFDEVVQRYELEKSELRLLIRPSGTEPVVRVMIEALNGDFVDEFSSRVAIQFS